MSQLLRLSCRGAPRDLGLDQGRARRDEIRRALAASQGGALARLAFALAPPAAARAAERDTFRFFPHMAERRAGLARGAGVSARSLAPLEAAPEPSGDHALRIVQTPGGPCVARALVASPLVALRESAPDADYRSLELAEATRIAPWIGVNERGLAVGAAAIAAPARAAAGEECAAPATLLAQDCLQRFDCVETAIEWILRRPAGGRAQIALADAGGAFALLEIDGASRMPAAVLDTPFAASITHRSWVVVADPRARSLGWTFQDGTTGEAALG